MKLDKFCFIFLSIFLALTLHNMHTFFEKIPNQILRLLEIMRKQFGNPCEAKTNEFAGSRSLFNMD